ncbi:hypothetical protein Tco_1178169, partial [Tanacetum coccineum]
MDVGTSHISGYAEGSIILDFSDPTRHSFAEQQDYGDVEKFRCNGPRYSRDYTYECLFRQTGSVLTQGKSLTNKFGSDKPLLPTADSVQTFSYDMQDNPTSYLEVRPMGDEYSRRNTNNKGPVILDFENSVVQSPSVIPASSGFQVVNAVDMLATQNNYPSNVQCPASSFFGDRNYIHTNGESSRTSLNGVEHLWPTADSKGPVILDFENQAVHLASTIGSLKWVADSNIWHTRAGANSDVASKRKSTICREPLPNVTSQGVSSFYIDIGDCEYSCQYCGAKFWYGERLQRSSTYQVPNYHKCCLGGKVRLGAEPHPPDYIRLLFKNRRFMENIRAYNQMFSMTSFGARVEDSINNGRAPYVFKISGGVYHLIGSLCPNEGDPPRFLQLYIYDTKNEVANRMRHFGGISSGNLEEAIVQGLINILDEHNELVRLFRTTRDKCAGQFVPDFKLRLYSVVGAREYDLPTSKTLGGIVFQNGQDTETDYDVIIQSR